MVYIFARRCPHSCLQQMSERLNQLVTAPPPSDHLDPMGLGTSDSTLALQWEAFLAMDVVVAKIMADVASGFVSPGMEPVHVQQLGDGLVAVIDALLAYSVTDPVLVNMVSQNVTAVSLQRYKSGAGFCGVCFLLI